jgi:hypothetical protein
VQATATSTGLNNPITEPTLQKAACGANGGAEQTCQGGEAGGGASYNGAAEQLTRAACVV